MGTARGGSNSRLFVPQPSFLEALHAHSGKSIHTREQSTFSANHELSRVGWGWSTETLQVTKIKNRKCWVHLFLHSVNLIVFVELTQHFFKASIRQKKGIHDHKTTFGVDLLQVVSFLFKKRLSKFKRTKTFVLLGKARCLMFLQNEHGICFVNLVVACLVGTVKHTTKPPAS